MALNTICGLKALQDAASITLNQAIHVCKALCLRPSIEQVVLQEGALPDVYNATSFLMQTSNGFSTA